jgi:AraC-like DNA-binding protein
MPKMRQTVVRTYAFGHSSGYTIPPHKHDWGQLICAASGVMTVHTTAGSWVVPPERGVWIPGGIMHSIEMSGQVSVRTLYFAPGFARRRLPKNCTVINISPLMRELVLHAITIKTLDARLIAVLVDQIQAMPEIPLDLAMPTDARAKRAAALLRADPGESSLDKIAREAGASKRTLERKFRSETGMGLGRWRQQLRLLHALRLLAQGEPVTSVALESGYQSTSAFISMFKRALGTTPFRYNKGERASGG